MKQPLGLILAGGRATRMGGGDKGRLMLGQRTLFARVIERIGPQVAALALNANGEVARFADLGLPVLPDGLAGFPGPLAGVLAGLDWAAVQGASHIVTVAADTPFFPEDLVPRLLLASETEGQPIALAASEAEGRALMQPTFGLWPVALRQDLRASLAQGERKVRRWAGGHGVALAPFPAGRVDPFFNINTPEDLARAEAMLG
ncbi:molybdenum cofactor guanylyltransferase MobA [Nioella nitratireducens]|uniref:molybdenum cofactor guanylyltransferase MobA n=1 Tax=Nioella nitratireducens TaxID=1287720 RepID=UPI0008FD68E9|nr:molybdenum cofactor guanylyltransferase MobA [Nioella nitratireducens]